VSNRGEGFIIEQKGPDGWVIVGTGFLFGTALIIIALAIFNISVYLGWSAVILAIGSSTTCLCFGTARIIEARGSARAQIIRAEGQSKALQKREKTHWLATMRQKPLPPMEER